MSRGVRVRSEPWRTRLARLLAVVRRRSATEANYAEANCESVRRTLQGLGPDSERIHGASGARMVVNLSSAHVPAFCRAAREGAPRPYLNCYDLQAQGRASLSEKRIAVDRALPLGPAHGLPQTLTFAAVEVGGTGMRYYGDVCLVIAPGVAEVRQPLVLDRNSYDVLRDPTRSTLTGLSPAALHRERQRVLREWSGTWSGDLGNIASVKAMQSLTVRNRRWTAAMVSEAVRSDEDCIEVLLPGSFGTADLQEARFPVAESAVDALVSTRAGRLPGPDQAALLWLERRRDADTALRAAGVPTRVVTNAGRTRD